MAVDLNNFLHSLCLHLASAASLQYAGTPRALWRNQADEASATDPYSVLRIYGGPPRIFHPLPRLSVQVMTVGTGNDASLSQAQKLYDALTDAASGGQGVPIQGLSINGLTTAGAADGHWKIVSVDLMQLPGMVGRDDRGRVQVVFNFEIAFCHTA